MQRGWMAECRRKIQLVANQMQGFARVPQAIQSASQALKALTASARVINLGGHTE